MLPGIVKLAEILLATYQQVYTDWKQRDLCVASGPTPMSAIRNLLEIKLE